MVLEHTSWLRGLKRHDAEAWRLPRSAVVVDAADCSQESRPERSLPWRHLQHYFCNLCGHPERCEMPDPHDTFDHNKLGVSRWSLVLGRKCHDSPPGKVILSYPVRQFDDLSAPKSQRFLRFAIAMPIADPRNRSDFRDKRKQCCIAI